MVINHWFIGENVYSRYESPCGWHVWCNSHGQTGVSEKYVAFSRSSCAPVDLLSAGCVLHRPLGVCIGYWPVAGPLFYCLLAYSARVGWHTNIPSSLPMRMCGPSLTQNILLEFMVNYRQKKILEWFLFCSLETLSSTTPAYGWLLDFRHFIF